MTSTRPLVGSILVFGPPFVFVLVFLIYPYLRVLEFSFYRVENYEFNYAFNLENYVRALTGELYQRVLFVSARIGAIVTLCTVPLAYLLAYYAAFVMRPWRQI